MFNIYFHIKTIGRGCIENKAVINKCQKVKFVYIHFHDFRAWRFQRWPIFKECSEGQCHLGLQDDVQRAAEWIGGDQKTFE